MIVRQARPKDAGEVRAIINDVILNTTISFKPNPMTEDAVLQLFETAPCVFVAEINGDVVGYASYDQFRRGAGYSRTMEHSIALSAEARGQGVGRALVSTLEDHARRHGVGSLWAGVSGENPGGVKFHSRLGYDIVASLPKVGFKFERWIDLTLMRKWLLPEGDAGRGSE